MAREIVFGPEQRLPYQPRRSDRGVLEHDPVCSVCGSRRHTTTLCTERDDQLGPEFSRTPRTVEVGPLGSRRSRRKIALGDLWASPSGVRYRVDKVERKIVIMRRSDGSVSGRVSATRLRRSWFFVAAAA